MRRPVRILPDALADQIAAGEVVERPASVVKELVENALDAGATTLSVDIEAGGTALIRVSDDGFGMVEADARLAVLRHATSKIAVKEDLERIRTMGFRGEALPSIASVSRFTLTTRTREQLAATEVRLEGGAELAVREVGAAPGTTVTVRDLFFNVPARRKFLKSLGTESARVKEACLAAGLADENLRLTLTRDGKKALTLLPVRELTQRATGLFPEDQLARRAGARDGLEVEAMLSPPERARNGATHLHVFVNRRPVKDRALARAIAFAYGSVLPPGRYPVGVVWLSIAPERVDVNVHPQKTEVRFDDTRRVLDALTRVLAAELGASPFRGGGPAQRGPSFWNERLSGGAPAPAPAAVAPSAADPWGLSGGANVTAQDAPRGAALPYTGSPPLESALPSLRDASSNLLGEGAFASLRPIGQARRMFILCEGPRGLVVLDQHAADERVRYHRLRAAFDAKKISMQRLLIPERVEVSPQQAVLVEERGDELLAMGLELARLGESTVAVHAVPALVARARPERLVHDVLAQVTHEGERAFGDAVDTALATMACHGAIRGGDALSDRELSELLRALDAVDDFKTHCPHGRPVVYEIGWDELGRRVGR